MAVTFDAASTSKVLLATSLTFSHTCSGGNRVLTVGSSTDVAVDTTGITYNAIAMTFIAGISGGANQRSELFGLIAPATGANNIVITVASATGIVGGGISYNNANQTTAFGTAATATGTSTTPSVVVTSATGNLVVDVMTNGVGPASTPTAAVGAGQTQRYNDANADKNRSAGSTEAGAAAVTMSWTLSASEQWTIVGVGVIAAPAVGSGGNFLSF